MKKVCKTILAILLISPVLQVNADETAGRIIERIQINGRGGPNNAVYYFVSSGGWGGGTCDVDYVLVNQNAVGGAKEMLSLAFMAVAQQKPVSFLGTCDGTPYFKADYMYFSP